MYYCQLAIPVLMTAVACAPSFGASTTSGKADISTQAGQNNPARYVVGPGDVLQITVYKEPDLSVPAVTVRSDGRISVPLLKEVEAGGLTPSELADQLTQKLSKLVRDADVTVVVKEIHSEQVYVIGAVKKEGPVALNNRLTVLQAISAAGGFTDYAKRRKVYVLRSAGGNRQTRIGFDYDAVLKGTRIEQNVVLQPGDTVVIPQ
jgi:polysaccharide export outer membrane protein